MKLTKANITKLELPPGKREHFEWDDDIPGYGLRLRAGGARTLVFSYRQGFKQRRMTLCSATALDDLGFQRTRKRAAQLHAQVRLGDDPAGQKIENRAAAAETFAPAMRLFLARQQERLKPRTYAEVERHLLKQSKPLHELRLAKIDRRTIAGLLAQLVANNGKRAADAVRGSLSTFFVWAWREGLVDGNPVTGTNRAHDGRARDRVLGNAELRAIWNALPDDHYGSIVKLLALTGQRRDEIGGLRWPEIDVDNNCTITLPPARTKNKRQHIVPLSSPALAILQVQPLRSLADGTPRELVFGIREGGFSGWSDAKERLDTAIAEAAGKPPTPWRLHDLRRTLATGMADIGIAPHIIEAVLNHVSGHKAGVAGVYNRSTYEREKRIALDRWADHLLAIVEGRDANIVPLRNTA